MIESGMLLSHPSHEFAGVSEHIGSKNHCVIFVHGLAAGRSMFRYLEPQLRAAGFHTLNWGYRSVRLDIPTVARALQKTVKEIEAKPQYDKVHLVTHSMGGIITRTMLLEAEFQKMGRIVMLGPPHQGSRVAANLAPFLGWFCPSLKQLSDQHHSFVRRLPEPVGYEIGIVAAAWDRVVHVDSTHLAGQQAHVVVAAGHNGMLFRRDVSRLVNEFLCTGRFPPQQQGHRMGITAFF